MGANDERRADPLADRPLERARALIDEGELLAAKAILSALVDPARHREESAVDIARLAQELGRPELALAELEAAASADPENAELRDELSELRDDLELGSQRADEPVGSKVEQLVSPATRRHSSEASVDPLVESLLQPKESDLVRFVHIFGGREDVHARQWFDPERGSGYSPIRSPITPDLARSHLSGAITLGSYVIRLDSTVIFFVIDIDLTRHALQRAGGVWSHIHRLRECVEQQTGMLLSRARKLGMELIIEDSGFKGRHLWGFLEQPLPAEMVFRFGKRLISRCVPLPKEISIEFFPKQRAVKPGGLGSLVKLPLGIHRRSGRRALFLDQRSEAIDDPWPLLRHLPKISRECLLDGLSTIRKPIRAKVAVSMPAQAAVESTVPHPVPRLERLDEILEDPALAQITAGCSVIDSLVRKSIRSRRLSYDEQVVLIHSLGHLPAGVEIVNALFLQCPEVPSDRHLHRRHRGNPISCPRIRKRIPELTSTLDCFCELETVSAGYPTPLMHVAPDDSPSTACEPTPSPARLDSPTLEKKEHDQGALQQALCRALALLPDRTLRVSGGRWKLEATPAGEALTWTSDGEE